MIKKYICTMLAFSITCQGQTPFHENIWASKKRLNFSHPSNYRELEALFMGIWAKVDLIRAINVTAQDKLEFIGQLVDEIVYIYATTCRFLHMHDYNSERIKSLYGVTLNLKETIIEAFSTSKSDQVTTLTCLLENLALAVKKKGQ